MVIKLSAYDIWRKTQDLNQSFDSMNIEAERTRLNEEYLKFYEELQKFEKEAAKRIEWVNQNVNKSFTIHAWQSVAERWNGGGIEYNIAIRPVFTDKNSGKILRDDYNDQTYPDKLTTKYNGQPQKAFIELLADRCDYRMHPGITDIVIDDKYIPKIIKQMEIEKRPVPEFLKKKLK